MIFTNSFSVFQTKKIRVYLFNPCHPCAILRQKKCVLTVAANAGQKAGLFCGKKRCVLTVSYVPQHLHNPLLTGQAGFQG